MAAADKDWEKRVAKYGHCSAFVKVTGESKDLLVGHTTWDDYSKMTRIFKYYKFHVGAHTFASHIAMSSYPGCVSSTDNFYMLNSGLVVMDTNFEIINPKIYDRIREFPRNSHLPTWMHVMVANRMARSGPQWSMFFGEQNNGQDNAQWIIVDYNNFSPGGGVPDNTVLIVETIPGMVQKTDVSPQVDSSGYFASYNRPMGAAVRDATGHTAAEAFYGKLYSYGANPRAEIFASFASGIQNLF